MAHQSKWGHQIWEYVLKLDASDIADTDKTKRGLRVDLE
jgi:hypothetical protein